MSNDGRHRIGIIGCGNVFGRYVDGLRSFDALELVWCADLDQELAQRQGAAVGIQRSGSPASALAGDLGEVEIVLNLTPPAVHGEVIGQILEAGKHAYTEKPLALTLEVARELLELAASRELQIGVAPDWFLGSAGRTARAAIRGREIGDPVAHLAFISSSNVETWHPDPTIFYARGGGPVFDLGPYYVSVLVDCLGPVHSLAALERIGAESRAVTAPERVVDVVDVEVPTHATAVLEHSSGVIGNLTMSFEARERTMPFIEIYGTEGTLSLPMPHAVDGPVRIKRHDEADWRELEPAPGPQYARGAGLEQMAEALARDEEIRASGVLGYHILEVLCAVGESSAGRAFVEIGSAEQVAGRG